MVRERYITTKSRLHMEKQSIFSLNVVKNDNLLPEGRTRIVLKYGTIVNVPSVQTNLIEELQTLAKQ